MKKRTFQQLRKRADIKIRKIPFKEYLKGKKERRKK